MIYRNQVRPPASPAPSPAPPSSSVPVPNNLSTPNFSQILEGEQLALISNLRQLWMQLAIWERSYIVSTAGNLGDIQMLTDRLLYIPEAFSELLGQYFEPQEANHFSELMEEHISDFTALVSAEKNDDDQTVNQETVNLYDNAKRMAAYLVSINPYWNQEQLEDALDDYIEMLLTDLVSRLTADYAKEIDVFDDLQTQAIKIADMMSEGMLEKFHP